MSVLNKERGPVSDGVGAALTLGAVVAFAMIMYSTAWLCDDAYISYRVAENFLDGNGLRWNVVERVQPFTHPLWLFLNTAVFAVWRDGYLTWLAVAMGTSLLAVCVAALGLARNWGGAVLAVGLLCFSRAFMDYSTSGLENPLSYLLLGLFAAIFFRRQWGYGSLFALSLAASLATLNRMDTLLFFLPALAYAWLTLRGIRALFVVFLGFLPFIGWEVFSIVYYGFPFPNTAYAKLGTGIDSGELIAQGFHYLNYTLQRDPSTFIFLGLGLLVPFIARDFKAMLLSLGGLLYVVYVIKIGGDFMGGRFLAVPFLLSVILLSRLPMPISSPRTWIILGIGAAVSLSRPFSPPTTGQDFGERVYDLSVPASQGGFRDRIARLQYGWNAFENPQAAIVVPGFKDDSGVGDERRFYYQVAGLLQWQPGKEMPTHSYAQTGRQYRATQEKGPKIHGSVGFRGFFGGPSVYIIDSYALADPLLARLPARYAPNWRIGHFTREIPAGYQASVLDGPNVIQDRQLAEYYDILRLITRGPLFDPARLEAVWNMNTGKYAHLVDDDQYRFAGMRRMPQSSYADPKPEGTAWNAPGTLQLNLRGAEFQLGEAVHNSMVEASLDNRDTYRLLFMLGGKQVGKRDETIPPVPRGGLALVKIPVPLSAVRAGYDAIRVIPIPGGKEEKYALGHIRPL
ncbi:MAG: hypothetical protein GC168_13100 [Candidatus Hydrogenedens sp.]|nr:hypothetical protein [Candidatus Hydrogenedens sp.]